MRRLRIRNVFLRWLVYGYAFGWLGFLTLLAIFLVHDWTAGQDASWALDYVARKGRFGFVWAVPWAVANGVCGLASKVAGARVAAGAAVAGVAAGVAYNFSGVFTFGGWLVITLPVICIPLMLGAVGVACAVDSARRA